MNYFTFSLVMGCISYFLLYIYNYRYKIILPKKKYIQFFIYSTLFSLASIYGYLRIHKLTKLDYRNNLSILLGTPTF